MAWYDEEDEGREVKERFIRKLEGLTGKKVIRKEGMSVIYHEGQDLEELSELGEQSRSVFRKPITFVKHIIETLQTDKKRRENRARAIKETNERVEARYLRRKRENPDKDISRFISTNDLDINALLDRPDHIGEKLHVIHTGMFDKDRKLIKKKIKKRAKRKKKALKKNEKDIKIEVKRLEKEIVDLENRV